MIVPIKISQESNDIDWCILELQGEILGDEISGFLGSIRIDGDEVKMGIGQHVLWGKIITLNNPFLVIDKTKNGLESKGYANKKIIFSNRPKPKTSNNSDDLFYDKL